MIEHIRLSQQAKDQLIKLKRVTGLQHWNELCRWALCASLAEPTSPLDLRSPLDSNVEMSWKIFGGSHGDIYLAALKQRCRNDGLPLDPATISQQFRLHLHRGIGYLATDRRIKSIGTLLLRGVQPLTLAQSE